MVNIFGFAGRAASTTTAICILPLQCESSRKLWKRALGSSQLYLQALLFECYTILMCRKILFFALFFDCYKRKSMLRGGRELARSPAVVWPLLVEDADIGDNHFLSAGLCQDRLHSVISYLPFSLFKSEFDSFSDVVKIVVPLLILHQNSDSC